MTRDALLDTSVGNLVVERPSRSAIFERYGIDYCCGGKRTLREACLEKGLDSAEVAQKVHASDGAAGPGQGDWQTLAELCDHIEGTHHAYLREELPRLTQLVDKVAAVHGEQHRELLEVQQVFAGLRGELEPHMMKEEQILFPAIRQIEQSSQAVQFPFGTVSNPIHCMEHEHDATGEALSKIRALTADYQPPEGACPTYHAMLDALHRLELDTHQHIHKENNILFPRAQQLEQRRTAGTACSDC